MIRELTDDCFTTIITLVESGDPSNIFRIISENSPEDCARIYVASLMLQGRDFPPVIEVSEYSTVLNDQGAFYELYKAASCGGISVFDIKSLYDSSELPEMVWTKTDRRARQSEEKAEKPVTAAIDTLFDAIGINPVYTVLKPGGCPLSAAVKALRRKGATVKSYKAVINKKPVILNVAEYNGSISCDINTLYCKDIDTFIKEFKRKFLNK